MVAKDHFSDNLILGHLFGFKKMLTAWGMIFVERKKRAKEKAQMAVSMAVKKLLSTDQPFSIYPQGTRSWGQKERNDSRWDAAYFCVGHAKRLKQEKGHLKKGVGFIAVETGLSLIKLRLRGDIIIFPVAMVGPGTACPKGSTIVRTQTRVVIKIGKPISFKSEELDPIKNLSYQEAAAQPLYQEKVAELVDKLDHSFQDLLDIAKRLERRFFTDLREILGINAMDEMAIAFKHWRKDGNLVYMILDCIYALPMKHWHHFLVALANILRNDGSREDLLKLRDEIAELFR